MLPKNDLRCGFEKNDDFQRRDLRANLRQVHCPIVMPCASGALRISDRAVVVMNRRKNRAYAQVEQANDPGHPSEGHAMRTKSNKKQSNASGFIADWAGSRPAPAETVNLNLNPYRVAFRFISGGAFC